MDTEERRLADIQWRASIDDSVTTLTKGQADLLAEIKKNNEMTEAIQTIIEGTKAFWSFCCKAAKVCIWTAKKGTIIAVAVTAAYHAIDAIASHDIGALVAKWWNRK